MSVVVRLMCQQDRAGIARLLDNIPQFKPFEVTVALELIDEYLARGNDSGYRILVAEDAGILVGYICYGPTPLTKCTWDIYWEAVLPARQGERIGKKLLKSAEEDIRATDGHLILIETSSSSAYKNTQNYYISNGYQLAARIPDFYAPDDDRLTYSKKL